MCDEVYRNGNSVYFTGNINTKNSCLLVKSIVEAQSSLSRGSDTIDLHINSVGGSLPHAYAVVDQIKYYSSDGIVFNTFIHGLVGSAAVLLSSCGVNRYIGKHAEMFIHPTSHSFTWTETENLLAYTEFNKDIYKDYCEVLLHAEGMTPAKTRELSKILDKGRTGDVYINSKQAIKAGLATEMLKGW